MLGRLLAFSVAFWASAAAALLTGAQAQSPAPPPPHVCATSAGRFPVEDPQLPLGAACWANTAGGRVQGVVQARPPLYTLAPSHHAAVAADIASAPIGAAPPAHTFSYTGPETPELAHAKPPPPPPPPPPPTTGGFSMRDTMDANASGAPVGTRLFAPADGDIPKGYGAIGVVAFSHGPADAAEADRYKAACRAYLTVLPDSAEIATDAPERPQMVTVWPRTDIKAVSPVNLQTSPRKVDQICDEAVAGYAYAMGDRWIDLIAQRKQTYAAARGPILIAWAPPQSMGKANTPILIFDLSNFDQPEDFEEAFQIWKTRIESDPDLWSQGWSLTRWRLYTRASLDHYGPLILSALKLLPWSGGGKAGGGD